MNISDDEIRFVVRPKTMDRLRERHFRGCNRNLSGNFCLWSSVRGVLNNRLIKRELLDELKDLILSDDCGTYSLQINFGNILGWSCTDEIANYNYEDLEVFHPNRGSTALRVKTNRSDKLARLTTFLTIIFELKKEDKNGWFEDVVVIHSMYPGKDIGELSGDVTNREGVVFFDWSHPGEPINKSRHQLSLVQ